MKKQYLNRWVGSIRCPIEWGNIGKESITNEVVANRDKIWDKRLRRLVTYIKDQNIQ